MARMIQGLRHELGQTIRFCVVGVANTLVGLSVIYGCKLLFAMNDALANVLGYAVGLTVSFALNSTWTFEYCGPRRSAAVRFVIVFLVSYLVNLATVMGLIHIAAVNSYLAHAAGMPVYTGCFYLLSRNYAFRSRS